MFYYRCAPGYYGNPLLIGSSCKKCDCSGNSDPNLIFEDCDDVTGQCRNCLRNTTGFNCELCAPGYYGDARRAKNCTGTYFANSVIVLGVSVLEIFESALCRSIAKDMVLLFAVG